MLKFHNDVKLDLVKKILTFSGYFCLSLCLVAGKAEEK